MRLFDVHAHLTHPDLLPDVDAVLTRAAAAGVGSIVVNGLNPADNEAVRALAARHPIVRPAFGLYPVDAVLPEMLAAGVDYPRDGVDPVPWEEAVAWVADHVDECVAVGEIGLDGYWVPDTFWARQEAAFRALVQLALDADKPIIIHTRKREQRAMEVLVEMGARRVDWHCFGGKVKLGQTIAALPGQYLSIPANARKNEAFLKLVDTLPKDRILLETDCPYLSPERGTRNEPANVAHTVAVMAERWRWPEHDVVARLSENFEALFGFAP